MGGLAGKYVAGWPYMTRTILFIHSMVATRLCSFVSGLCLRACEDGEIDTYGLVP